MGPEKRCKWLWTQVLRLRWRISFTDVISSPVLMHLAISVHVFILVELWNSECPERAFHLQECPGTCMSLWRPACLMSVSIAICNCLLSQGYIFITYSSRGTRRSPDCFPTAFTWISLNDFFWACFWYSCVKRAETHPTSLRHFSWD